MQPKQYKTLMVLTFSASLWASLVQSAPIYYTEQYLYGFDTSFNYDNIITPVVISGSSPTSSLIGDSIEFNGLDSSGNNATATAQYSSGAASLAGGTLKSTSSLSLSNGFFNDANALLDGPAQFGVLSRSGYSDSITVASGNALAGLFGLRVELRLDGSTSESTSTLNVHPSVQVSNANGSVWSYGYQSSQGPLAIDQTINLFFPVIAGIAEVDIALVTETILLPRLYPGGSVPSYLEMESNFFNTLSVTAIAGFDQQDNPVDLISATSSDGFQFDTIRVGQPPSSVPEPATSFLFIAGLLGLGFARHRMCG